MNYRCLKALNVKNETLQFYKNIEKLYLEHQRGGGSLKMQKVQTTKEKIVKFDLSKLKASV